MDRPYRNAYSHTEAIDMLQSMRGNALDPEIVDIFLSVIKKTLSSPHEVSFTAGVNKVAVG